MIWLILVVVAVVAGVLVLHKKNQYWRERGVVQGSPYPIVGDNWGPLFRVMSFAEFVQFAYNIGPDKRYSGFYQMLTPTLTIRDAELIKRIGVKDFEHFINHRTFIPEDVDPLWGKNLFALQDQRWKDMRTTLSPSFTSSKMRAMFVLIAENAEQFSKFFLKRNEDLVTIEMKDTFTRFTNDVIASAAFGIKVDSLENRDNEFYLMGKEATDFSSLWRNLKFFAFLICPSVCRVLNVKLFSNRVDAFFKRLVSETIAVREKNNVVRPDMIHLLMEAKKHGIRSDEPKELQDAGFATVEEADLGQRPHVKRLELTDEDITAQALIFFFAGFDSVSGLMCFTGYELAANPDVQRRLLDEVDEVKERCAGGLTYEALLGMKYMDMVVSETLRKWPNAVAVDRICNKDYTIEPQEPGEAPLLVEKGTVIWFPIFAIQRDPKHYPEPDRFDPERFSDANKAHIQPYTYIPFGVGPRNCIGSRFALLETKALVYYILKDFEIVPVEKTVIPLKLSRKSFNLGAEGGFWMGLKRRTPK